MIHSFLQPLDRSVPMVATEDVGRTAAALLQDEWTGARIVELEGPRRVSPNDRRCVRPRARAPGASRGRPRDTWAGLFDRQQMRYPEPRMRMLDGFNEGWIDFASAPADVLKGNLDADAVLRTLVTRAA